MEERVSEYGRDSGRGRERTEKGRKLEREGARGRVSERDSERERWRE